MGIWSKPTFFLKDLKTFRLQIIVEGALQSLCANFEASRVKGDRVAPKEWEVKQEQKPGIKALPVAQSSWFWNMLFFSRSHTRISLFHDHCSLLKLLSFLIGRQWRAFEISIIVPHTTSVLSVMCFRWNMTISGQHRHGLNVGLTLCGIKHKICDKSLQIFFKNRIHLYIYSRSETDVLV